MIKELDGFFNSSDTVYNILYKVNNSYIRKLAGPVNVVFPCHLG